MKLSEIMTQVGRDIDDDYNLDDIKDWVNRCLDDLTPIANKQSLLLTDVNSDNAYDLPDDLYEIAFVKVNDEIFEAVSFRDDTSKGYKRWENTVYLQPAVDTGTMELYYYRKLNHVEEADDIPDLEPEYHDLFIFYCLGNAQFYDEDYEYRPDSNLRYENRKKEYILFTQKKSRKKRVTEKVIW
jgi:hypothetical protein